MGLWTVLNLGGRFPLTITDTCAYLSHAYGIGRAAQGAAAQAARAEGPPLSLMWATTGGLRVAASC